MLTILEQWISRFGLEGALVFWASRGLAMALVLALGLFVNIITRRVLMSTLKYFISRSKTTWDDAILKRKVLNRLAHIAPAIIIYLLAPAALAGLETAVVAIKSVLSIYMILVVIFAIDGLLNAVIDIYRTYEISKEIPIRSFVQILKIILYFLAAVFTISIILNKTPLYLLSGLGALTAVLLLIFKDSILGFVAGIQLTANRMIAHGDWIEMPRYGADGDVMEVTLTTVKVQNFDKTITTIPTYALIGESFKNWRGMQESGGRRIKRAINIDMNSIKFCSEEMLERFSKIQYLAEYINQKKAELTEFNASVSVDTASLVNGRRMTNIGTFRIYIVAYLKNHPQINPEMTFLVRQLKPSPDGLPIEIYVFCRDNRWVNYEAIQADIFDHLLAVIPEFELRVFQNPTGQDMRCLIR